MPDTLDQFWDELAGQSTLLVPSIRQGFFAVIARARRMADPDAIEAALAEQNLDKVVSLLLGPPGSATWHEFEVAIRSAASKAVNYWAADLTVQGIPALFRFAVELQNPRALAEIRMNAGQLIVQVDEVTRAGIRGYVLEQVAQGRNPRSLVTELVGQMQEDGTRKGGILGLTDRQARAVANYRRFLTELDPQALERELRDHRWDGAVSRAIENQTPLHPDVVEELVNRYTSRYLAYRATTIGRSESIHALAEGQKALWDSSLAENGAMREVLTKRWVTALDERVRPDHAAMHNVEVSYDEEFTLPDGRTTWGPPFDPNCRCLCWIRPRVIRRVA